MAISVTLILRDQRDAGCAALPPAALRLVRVRWRRVASTLPVGSITATLQPVRKAGSSPSTVCPASGGWVSRPRKLGAKTLMAWLSAASRQVAANVALDRREQQAFGGVGDGQFQLLGQRRAAIGTKDVSDRHAASRARPGRCSTRSTFLGLAPVDRQDLIGLHAVDPRLEGVIRGEDAAFSSSASSIFSLCSSPHLSAFSRSCAAHLGVVADGLGDDVARPGEGVFDVGTSSLRKGAASSSAVWRARACCKNQIGQSLQALVRGRCWRGCGVWGDRAGRGLPARSACRLRRSARVVPASACPALRSKR